MMGTCPCASGQTHMAFSCRRSRTACDRRAWHGLASRVDGGSLYYWLLFMLISCLLLCFMFMFVFRGLFEGFVRDVSPPTKTATSRQSPSKYPPYTLCVLCAYVVRSLSFRCLQSTPCTCWSSCPALPVTASKLCGLFGVCAHVCVCVCYLLVVFVLSPLRNRKLDSTNPRIPLWPSKAELACVSIENI